MKKAAIIGLGDVASIHLAELTTNKNIELVAAADIDESTRDKLGDQVAFYKDYKAMLENHDLDCVHICLPHYLHYKVSKEVVESGVNVLCEKPIAIDIEEAKKFIELSKKYEGKIKIGVVLQNRLNQTVEVLKSIIASNKYGQVLGINGFVPWYRPKEYYQVKNWRGKKALAGGGCMINQSIHTLDLLYYLAGGVDSVSASVSKVSSYEIEVEDTVTASLQFKNGARGLFWATNMNYENQSVQISVKLEKADYRIFNNSLYQLDEDDQYQLICQDERLPGKKFYYGASHSKLISNFYKCLEEDTNDYITIEEATVCIELIDAIMRSSKQEAKVNL